ncbi:alkylglycerol monooxygenase-like [Stegodyphus dumicola]|uniref:alkylglycerol monooxygenase-like n=1 Tax=Stegodyphus dumicola TaxID=202533 RepID=UPI0015B0DFC4|nr:alkylglycerol monooxygenase-like [Stegodyphus dumicola]
MSFSVLFRGIQFVAYTYIYNNWRLVTLPWNSIWTWWICFLGVDFGYYWLHRASHEINILWAAHQVHHSSEDYNLSTALRQSVLQNYSVWVFYLPMALAVPPSVFLVHNQFNLLYQFWIHTEVIRSLGPLEYVLNTASHHRVHHGRNRYCIDKNYGGTLIIWDRIFGTFEPENEEVVYGLTHPVSTFEPIYIQLCHYLHIWRTFWETQGLKNKLSVIFKGPGWSPEKPWHGCIDDIPDVKAPAEKYDPSLPSRYKAYILWHFVVLGLAYVEITERNMFLPQFILYVAVLHQVFSLSIIGMFLEGRFYAISLECLRCLLSLAMTYYFLPHTRIFALHSYYQWFFMAVIYATYGLSAVYWLHHCFKNIKIKITTYSMKKVE